jgi:hypothetical protein
MTPWSEGTLTDELEKLRKDALALLMAPYTQTTPWAITTLCVYFEHPLTPRGERCPCGKVRTKKDTI